MVNKRVVLIVDLNEKLYKFTNSTFIIILFFRSAIFIIFFTTNSKF